MCENFCSFDKLTSMFLFFGSQIAMEISFIYMEAIPTDDFNVRSAVKNTAAWSPGTLQ